MVRSHEHVLPPTGYRSASAMLKNFNYNQWFTQYLQLRCFTAVLALIQYWQSYYWVIWPSKGNFKEGSLMVWFSLDASSPLFGWMGWGCPTLHPSLPDDPPRVDQISTTTNHRPAVLIQIYLVAFIPLHVFLSRNNQLLDHLLWLGNFSCFYKSYNWAGWNRGILDHVVVWPMLFL